LGIARKKLVKIERKGKARKRQRTERGENYKRNIRRIR